jgi:hypothetical protein
MRPTKTLLYDPTLTIQLFYIFQSQCSNHIVGSQCLEIGKDCSGYRTTLTWGVGVASRGKLRGLSLPIINSTAKACDQGNETKMQSSPAMKAPPSPPKAHEQSHKVKLEENYHMNHMHEFSQAPFSPGSFQSSGPIPIPVSSPQHHGWHVPGFYEHLEGYSALSGKPTRLHLRPRPLRRVHTTASSSYEEQIFSAPSTGSVSTFSESDFPSPSEFPPTPKEVPMAEPFINSYPDVYSCQQETMHPTESYSYMDTPRSYPSTSGFVSSSLGSSVSSNSNSNSNMCMDMYPPVAVGPTSFSDILHRNDYNAVDDMMQQFQYGGKGEPDYLPEGFVDSMVSPIQWNSAIPQTMDPSGFHHLAPRMRYLLDYYDKAICPVLVAFDNPKNPYRMHIMHLAVSNKPLQNAIAALATNNMRMRGLKELNGFSMDPFDHLTADDIRDMHTDATPEEMHYKSTSVALFNASLKDQNCAADDSVLATLLILCLFHVCDSGFSKFKTQLAGVQKLLSMRDRRGGTTEFIGWIEMFFTWFDVMTATVNDRETQVRGDALDMLDLSANLGALEHLAGCEGRLFKLIARLGRLNLMSQRRPVQDSMLPPSHTPTPRPSPGFATTKDFYSLDGNGWGTPVATSPPCAAEVPAPDPRHEFWTEWHHIRSRLSAWVLDPPYHTAPPPPMSEADNASIQNISQSFRHAALLYTERLGSPHLPPSAAPIQALVSGALRHIAAIPVNSCVNKFLLWPVFIVGTECVHAADRDIIRSRCIEITRESGFFNNMSCLEILERVWAEDDAGDGWEFVKVGESIEAAPMLSSLGAQAFRWRRAMMRSGGEYIVV